MKNTRTILPQLLVLLLLRASLAHTSEPILLQRDAFASSGGQSFKNVVRAADGTLYCLSIHETPGEERELRVQTSLDGGLTWDLDGFLFNDEKTGLVGDERTNGCAVAIDDRGVLHVTWGNYYYPSSYRQFYRNWDPVSGLASEIFDVSAWTGAAPTARTAAMDIAVDEDGIVWLVAHGPRSWVERLAHSVRAYGEGLEFVDVGNISPSASAQTTRLTIDGAGRVHCAFYRNIGAGQYEHRVFDPAPGWGPSTNLGNVEPENDLWGSIAADDLGHVHALFAVDASDNAPLWKFWYRRWNAADGWTDPITVFEVSRADREGIANNRLFALAVDEPTGEVTILYRDLNAGGALGVIVKALDDESFGEFEQLSPPTDGRHAYYTPSIRGRLYPPSDRTHHGRHATWQRRPGDGAPFELWFAPLDGTDPPDESFRRGDTDGDGTVTLTDAVAGLSSLFLPEFPAPACQDAADANDDGAFNLSDGVYTLNSLFAGGTPPPAPGPDSCGPDPSPDALDCTTGSGC